MLQAACALGAAAVLGNWFLAELRKAQAAGKPWYSSYLTVPGIIIMGIMVLLPLIYHLYIP